MIIGIDASRANKQVKTGTEWYSYNLILELAKIDHENKYWLYSPDKLKGKLAQLPENFKEKVLSWPPKKLWTMARLSFEMKKNPPDLLFVPAHIIPLASPKKTITTICDIGFVSNKELYSQKEIKYHNFGLKQAIKKATLILTISKFTKEEMVKFCKIDPNRIKVIYLGFSQNDYRKIEDQKKIKQIKNKYKLPDNYLFYTGRLNLKKNIPNLIKAFKQVIDDNKFKDYKLVMAGVPENGYEVIKEEIKLQGIRDKIIELGWTKEEDLPYLMNGAKLFVFPSNYEGFGIPPLEAMACGTPVVSSNAASLPEVCGNAALLFDPKNVDQMAEKIKLGLSDENLRHDLIQKGFLQIRKFSWEKCAKETLDALEEE